MTHITIEQAKDMGAKGAQPTEEERLLFEVWMAGHCWMVEGDWDGETYVHPAEKLTRQVWPGAMRTRMLWAAWRDRAALAAPVQEPVAKYSDIVSDGGFDPRNKFDLPTTGQQWAVFCGGCRTEWSVPYQHPGKSICAECEAKCKATPPAAQPAPVQEPLFWYRPCSNGMYEGPIHNAQIEEVRKQSGAWVPLVTATNPPAAPVQREHVTDKSCWCQPALDYKDPDTGAEVWVHNEPH